MKNKIFAIFLSVCICIAACVAFVSCKPQEPPTVKATADKYFTFTLIGSSYSIAAKDVNDLPPYVILPSTYNQKK